MSPVREEIINMIYSGCNLLDIGCGTGALLFKAESKIAIGIGVDLDYKMIRFSSKKKRKLKFNKIKFIHGNINSIPKLSEYNIDISTSTLCLHEMKEIEAVNTLKLLSSISDIIIIADYYKPDSFWAKVSIELDEIISGHYFRFCEYRKKGYFPYLAIKAGLKIHKVKKTEIDGILIWELNK